jgi:FAD/FMN-containing dehydrogenase
MVIDVSGLRVVTIDAAAGVATIEGGVTGTGILTAAEPFGLAAVTASSGGVGALGFMLGGGYGLLCGRSGLGADNLLSAEVVLADGSLVTADDEQNPDLLWALRGGGGNFGVITSARVQLHPVPTTVAGQVLYPWSQATAVFSLLGDLLLEAPDELTVLSGLLTTPTGDRAVFLSPVWSGDPDAPHPLLKAVTALGTPMLARFAPTSLAAMAADYERQYPAGARLSARTRTVPRLTPEVIDVLYRGAETFTSQRSVIALHHFHGAAARVPVQDTAVALRTPHLMAELVAGWEQGDPDVDRHRSWVEALSQDLAPQALPGGYVNLLTPEAADQVAQAYGPNTSRLLAIKARLDPDHVFAATPLPETSEENGYV